MREKVIHVCRCSRYNYMIVVHLLSHGCLYLPTVVICVCVYRRLQFLSTGAYQSNRGEQVLTTVQPRLSGPHLSGTSIIRTLSCPAMYLCACIEGLTVCIEWVWQLLNEDARPFAGWKTLEMMNEDAFMNPFGGLFEVKMPFSTKTY